MSHLSFQDFLGSGTFGEVYKVIDQRNHKEYAAKIIYHDKLKSQSDRDQLQREVEIMRKTPSNTTIRIHEFLPNFVVQKKKCSLIVMACAERGSLSHVIKKKPKGYDNTAKQIILIGVAYGMYQLHRQRIIHRDLKTLNILIDNHFYPYISDFGLSKYCDVNQTNKQTGACGTPAFFAPEMFANNGKQYDFRVDIYSFAYILYEVLTGRFPFQNLSIPTIFQKIQNNERPSLGSIRSPYSELIQQCWHQDPNRRPPFKQIFKLLITRPYALDGIDTNKINTYLKYIGYSNSQSGSKTTAMRPQTQQIQLNASPIKMRSEFNPPTPHVQNRTIPPNRSQPPPNQQFSNMIDKYNPLEGLDFQEMNKKIEREQFKHITIPSSVTIIGDIVGCNSLTQITIPSSVTEIGGTSFRSCYYLTQIIVDSGNSYFASFNGVLFTKDFGIIICYPIGKPECYYEIPPSVTIIGNECFSDSESLTEVIIPSSVTIIGYGAFSHCDSLKQIQIPSSVTTIRNGVFLGCSALTQIRIPSSVAIIEDRAFQDCTSLTQITIPSSVTTIGNNAFCDCYKLTQIAIPSSVTSIGNNPFAGCHRLTQIIVDSGNSYFASFNGVLFTKDFGIIICYPIGKPECYYEIPPSVTIIGNECFFASKSLTEVIIPSSVTIIGHKVFEFCESLKQIQIPSSVTSIGQEAFAGCSSLYQISIPLSIASIGYGAFSKCSVNPFCKYQLEKRFGSKIF